MLKDPGKSADTAKETVSGKIAYFTVPRKKLMGFRCGCAAGTDHKMVVNKAGFAAVPFPPMLMGRRIATNRTLSVISVNVVLDGGCRALCAVHTVTVIVVFPLGILPNVFMGRMSADLTDACTVLRMGEGFLFLTTAADHTVPVVIGPGALPIVDVFIKTANGTGLRTAVNGMIFQL
jgi:hypothetical protein